MEKNKKIKRAVYFGLVSFFLITSFSGCYTKTEQIVKKSKPNNKIQTTTAIAVANTSNANSAVVLVAQTPVTQANSVPQVLVQPYLQEDNIYNFRDLQYPYSNINYNYVPYYSY